MTRAKSAKKGVVRPAKLAALATLALLAACGGRDRPKAELEAAQRARHPNAVRAHYVLASLYLDRLYRPNGEAERRTA